MLSTSRLATRVCLVPSRLVRRAGISYTPVRPICDYTSRYALPVSHNGVKLCKKTKHHVRGLATCHQDIPLSEILENEKFYRYDGGRWLWGEEEEMRIRYRSFNVSALKDAAAKSIGARSCVSIFKLAEGQHNKIFRLTMDDGRKVIARIPMPNAGPAFYTVASEVATMEFVKSVLGIPVPKVYGWSSDARNPVGAEYILMEEPPGVILATVWDEFSNAEKYNIIEQIVEIERKFLSISFSHYGNLYFAADAVQHAVPAGLSGTVSSQIKEDVYRRFTIGPMANMDYWVDERSDMRVDRGPWSNPAEYLSAIAHREIAWLEEHAKPKPRHGPFSNFKVPAQQDPKAHIDLLRSFLKLVPHLVDIENNLLRPTIWHRSLNSWKFCVNREKAQITAVLDWQNVWSGPFFYTSEPADLLRYDEPILNERPDDYDTLDEVAKSRIDKQIAQCEINSVYLAVTNKPNPLLYRVLKYQGGLLMRRPVTFASQTWDCNVSNFREALMGLQRYWDHLDIKGECPYHFTEAEVKQHREELDGWNEMFDLFDMINLSRSGWVDNEKYDDYRSFLSSMYEDVYKDTDDADKEDLERHMSWCRG